MYIRCALILQATELDNGVATDVFTDTIVTINVNDVNDNGPVFSETTYSVMLDESPARGSAIPGLNVQVSDADSVSMTTISTVHNRKSASDLPPFRTSF